MIMNGEGALALEWRWVTAVSLWGSSWGSLHNWNNKKFIMNIFTIINTNKNALITKWYSCCLIRDRVRIRSIHLFIWITNFSLEIQLNVEIKVTWEFVLAKQKKTIRHLAFVCLKFHIELLKVEIFCTFKEKNTEQLLGLCLPTIVIVLLKSGSSSKSIFSPLPTSVKDNEFAEIIGPKIAF